MDEWDKDFEEEVEPTRPRAEGVRILGAEEAAAAVNAQRGDDDPGPEPLKFERPAPPPREPELFPRDENDPTLVTLGASTPAAPPNLPHWTEPPTGEVPAVLSGRFGETDVDLADDEETDDDLAAWSALSGGAPRWRDQHDAWDDAGFDDASVLAGSDPPMGALDERRPGLGSVFEFDEDDDADSFGDLGVADEIAPIRLRPSGAGGAGARPPRPRAPRPSRPQASPPRRAIAGVARSPRDLQAAVGLAVGLGAIALFLFKLGPAWAMILATAVVLMASAELYDVLRRAGYQPATLIGLGGTLGIMIGAYQKDETAIPLVIFLVVATTFMWYLVARRARAAHGQRGGHAHGVLVDGRARQFRRAHPRRRQGTRPHRRRARCSASSSRWWPTTRVRISSAVVWAASLSPPRSVRTRPSKASSAARWPPSSSPC